MKNHWTTQPPKLINSDEIRPDRSVVEKDKSNKKEKRKKEIKQYDKILFRPRKNVQLTTDLTLPRRPLILLLYRRISV